MSHKPKPKNKMKMFEFNKAINGGGTFRLQTIPSGDIEIVRTRSKLEREHVVTEDDEREYQVDEDVYEAGGDELLATIPKSKIPALIEWLKEVA